MSVGAAAQKTSGVSDPFQGVSSSERRSSSAFSPRRLHSAVVFTPSLRGALILLFGAILVIGPVQAHSDLYAAVVGYSLIALVLITLLFTFFSGWWLRRHSHFQMTYGTNASTAQSPHLTSSDEISIALHIKGGRILPFTSLEITPRVGGQRSTFPDNDNGDREFPLASWRLIGGFFGNESCSQHLFFPHRGEWAIRSLSMRFRDTLGLGTFRWSIDGERLPVIPLSPPIRSFPDLPIFTGETRSGVDQSDIQRQDGDAYDVKRYHPSDGMRRILWKVYARSGELLSRHPEPSMTPEGVVAIGVLAGKEDDFLCSLATAHLKRLTEEEYQFLVIADGAEDPISSPDAIARTEEEAERLFRTSVWKSESVTNSERISLIDALQRVFQDERGSELSRITLFISLNSISHPQFLESLGEFFEALRTRNIQPLWIIGDDRGDGTRRASQRVVQRLLFAPQPSSLTPLSLPKKEDTNREHALSTFLERCESNGALFQIVSLPSS
ncbi:DUF58 domain-containing protein [bacterium]|nr:DUF58 domain-containing protein [bacterium]